MSLQPPHVAIMKRLSLLIALFLAAPLHAQPELPRTRQPRVKEAAPQIDPEAKRLVDAMVARYAALPSYFDTTTLGVVDAKGLPMAGGEGYGFQGTLCWQRPLNIRFEGTNSKGAFLALGTDKVLRVVSPEHPGHYVERERNPPLVMTDEKGNKTNWPQDNSRVQFDAPLMEVQVGAPGFGFLLEPDFWTRTLKDVQVLSIAGAAAVDTDDGDDVYSIVRLQLRGDEGKTEELLLSISNKDGLLRRVEETDAGLGAGTRIVETHSHVTLNPNLPASTWDFEALAKAKPIDYFSQLNPHQFDPALKIGDLLPTFSGDDLKGQPLELNAESGKVTVLYFSNMGMGTFDVQILKKMNRVIGSDKLQIIFVSGDGARERAEEWTKRLQLPFPIYFDESGMRNPLAQKFGVKGWATTFIFGSDGKLKTICHHPSEVDFNQSIQNLLPGTPDDVFVLQDGEMISLK